MKRYLRNVARYFVILYSNRILRRRIKLADRLHAKKKTRFYVALDPMNSRNLLVMNRKGFRNLKRVFKIYDTTQTTIKLKEGSYYFTADAGENDPIPAIEKEARRLAFIQYMLTRAKL
jgi:hypothetical protein